MIFIVDANVIMSALIRDSKSRELLKTSSFTLYSPDTLLESIEKYKGEFIKRSGLTTKDFEILLNFILEKVKIIKREKYEPQLNQADDIMGHIDAEDVAYIALALSIENNGIWSDDAHFQRQNRVNIYKTEDVVKILEKEDKE